RARLPAAERSHGRDVAARRVGPRPGSRIPALARQTRRPRPLAGSLTESGAHRIREHVFEGGGEMTVVEDDPGGEALREEVASALVPAIEALGVGPVQPTHAGREALTAVGCKPRPRNSGCS